MLELEENNAKEEVHQGYEQERKGLEFQSNILKLYLFQFCMGFCLITGVLIPFFLTWGQLTFLEVMMLQGFFTFVIFAFEIPCGAISDYVSRKFSLFLGGVSLSISAIVYTITPNIFMFAIGETFFAIGFALISGTDQAIVYDTLRKMDKKEEFPKIIARSQSFNLLGIMISAPLGSLLALYIPIQFVFTLMAVPFIIGAVIALTLIEPNHDLVRENQKYLAIIKSGIKELKENKILRTLAIDYVLIDMIVFFIIWTYQLYLEELGFSIMFYGIVAALMTLLQIILSNLVPRFQKRFKNKRTFLIVYTLIPGISYILLATIVITPVSIILMIMIVGFGFTRNLIFVNGINNQMETDNRATVLSTISMLSCLSRGILYPIVGLLVMFALNFTFIFIGTVMITLTLLTRVKTEYL